MNEIRESVFSGTLADKSDKVMIPMTYLVNCKDGPLLVIANSLTETKEELSKAEVDIGSSYSIVRLDMLIDAAAYVPARGFPNVLHI